MNIEYFIGIDFGHGETSVSRVPGYAGELRSRIPLRDSSQDSAKKVMSAICKKNDKWKFVGSKEDLSRPNISEGFKGIISKLKDSDKEAFMIFAKLVFESMLQHDNELKYEPLTGEANFAICIANPSDWRRQDPDIPKQYKDFFCNECGIVPIVMCINESDAAFYSKHANYTPSDTVFVIDLGSSTIDFTTYYKSECIANCCWGYNLGAHSIEDSIIAEGYKLSKEEIEKGEKHSKNKKGIIDASNLRTANKMGPAEASLSLSARMDKEKFFTEELSILQVKLEFFDIIPNCPDDLLDKPAYSLRLNREQVYDVIAPYIKGLRTTLENAAQKLSSNGVNPTQILLSGGASRMPFVKEIAEEVFPYAKVDKDQTPEWVVSDGAAMYAKIYHEVCAQAEELHDTFRVWADANLIDVIKEAGLTAFKEAIRESMCDELKRKYVDDLSDPNLWVLERILKELLSKVTTTYKFKNRAEEIFKGKVNEKIANKLVEIIKKNYDKDITISQDFIDPKDYFSDVPVETGCIHENINVIAHNLFSKIGEDVNWEKPRKYSPRQQITDSAVRYIPDNYEYIFEGNTSDMIAEAESKIDTILEENGLFKVSV